MKTFTQLLRQYKDQVPVDRIRARAKEMREEDGVDPKLAAQLAVEEELDKVLAEVEEFWEYVEEQGGRRPRRPAEQVVREVFERFTGGAGSD